MLKYIHEFNLFFRKWKPVICSEESVCWMKSISSSILFKLLTQEHINAQYNTLMLKAILPNNVMLLL